MNKRRNNLISLAAILVLTAILAFITFGGNRIVDIFGTKINLETKLGLDLNGGYQLLLQSRNPSVEAEQMSAAREIIERRVSGLGTNEPVITIQGNNRINIELPGVTDEDTIRKAVGNTGRLEFIDAGTDQLNDGDRVSTTYCTTGTLFSRIPGDCGQGRSSTVPSFLPTAAPTTAPTGTVTPGTTTTPNATPTTTPATANGGKVYQTIVTGADLDPAKIFVGQNPNSGSYEVNFGLKSGPADTMFQFTSSNIQKNMAIVLDGAIISNATIQGAIRDQGQITNPQQWVGQRGLSEVQAIVTQLKYGALPVELDILSSRKIGATLGQDSIDRSLLAGGIGLGLVALFMILYFRVPGVIAVLALLIYSLLNFAIFKLFGVVLTLAGIAGFILSIGMAVDANVLIFARMKEELRLGRSLERAVEDGFRNAWPSIRDSNISSLITCAILYWFGDFTGTSVIKGFALTLAIGVACSMFSALTVSHTFLRTMFLFTGSGRAGGGSRIAWWYGMNRLANRRVKADPDMRIPRAATVETETEETTEIK
jgi:preprotein translocase subunit SecD